MKPAFVISPIGKPASRIRIDADWVLETFIRPAARKNGYEPYRGDEVSTPGMIVSHICKSILSDDLIFAYLKDGNPNVYYELAIAHTLRKPVVMLKCEDETIPFDIGGTRVISIDRDDVDRTLLAIEAQVASLLVPGSKSSSPLDIETAHVINSSLPRSAREARLSTDVTGIWSGYTLETPTLATSGIIQRYTARMQLEAFGPYITGTMYIGYGDDSEAPLRDTATLKLHGMARGTRFLRLHYDNDLIDHQCGLLFLDISADGREVVGSFAGYGVQSEAPVHGKVHFRKAI